MQIGQTIIVRDAANFYFGRKAVVTRVTTYGNVTVCTVAVGNVHFALRTTEMEAA